MIAQLFLYTAYIGLGFIGIALPTMRTLHVVDGNYFKVIPFSLLSSANLCLFTVMVADKNWEFIIFNAIGASMAVSILAYRRNKKNQINL